MRPWAAVVAVVLASAAMAAVAAPHDDYIYDGGPALRAVLDGDTSAFYAEMGPVSLLLRAPFVAAGQMWTDDIKTEYRLGTFPCLLALGLVALLLVRRMPGPRSPVLRAAVVGLLMANPIVFRAVDFGHPEDVLALAFLIAAGLAALDRRTVAALALVVLAGASKQWGFLALPLVMVAVGYDQMRRVVLVAAGVVTAVVVPLLLLDPSAFVRANEILFTIREGGTVFPANVWWPFTDTDLAFEARRGVEMHELPRWLAHLAHPLVGVVALAVALVAWRRGPTVALGRLFPALALVFLFRDVLDPVNNIYYHLPLVGTLIAAETIRGELPIRSVLVTGLLLATRELVAHPDALNAFYLAWTLPLAGYLGWWALSARVDEVLGERGEHLGPGGADDDQVLDPHSVPAR